MHADGIASSLDEALAALATAPVLLVASDFDGTLSEIASHPERAAPDREALVALRALASMPHTHVALISGRSLDDLARRVGAVDGVLLVGSHGSEFEPDFAGALDAHALAARERIRADVRAIAADAEGTLAEDKAAGVALHYRNAGDDVARAALRSVREGPASLHGVHVKEGKKVIELSVVPMEKGRGLATIRQRCGATAALFFGDDVTDEDAFGTLRGPDVGVKVGDGATRARFRVADPSEAGRLLARMCELRDAWLRAGSAVPIERHAMLSDQRTVALVTPDARIVWCCLPRIDSPALFAELVGGPMAGRFHVRPALAAGRDDAPRQRYVGDSMLVETRWRDVVVTDCLDCSAGRAFLRAGRTDLLRRVEGRGDIEIEFAPRLDFGRRRTRLRVVEDGLAIDGAIDPVVLRAPGVHWEIDEEGPHHVARARHALTTAPLVLELRYGLSTAQELVVPSPQRFEQTRRFWETWVGALSPPPLYADEVRRSALVVKALCYGPTGAIAAAATTSLPESLGGVRNWDYRFSWLRDAALAATALARIGSPGIGTKLLDWILGLLDREGSPEAFRPVYTVTGQHLQPEAELSELCGYRCSRPVRVGNAAAQQLQLDVFGPLLELVAVLARTGLALSAEHWRLTEAIVRAVANRWQEPDHGIWEIRGPQRHHVHSKTMCWVAVDRGMAIAKAFAASPPDEWIALREEIGRDVSSRGWSDALGSFVAAYDESTIDAATLHVGLSGLVAGDDPRFAATVERVERELRRGATVYRYRYDDGLPGAEAGFHLCTTWLIEALALRGERDRARALLDDYVPLFGPAGLAPEEYDPETRESLGNFPQAYSHLGLINAVLAVSGGR